MLGFSVVEQKVHNFIKNGMGSIELCNYFLLKLESTIRFDLPIL
jgi:hypothetical protein